MLDFSARPHLTRWLVAALLTAAVPAAAQRSREASPAGRTRAFLLALAQGADSAARFFPRRGDWTWVHTTEYDVGRKIAGVWRFRGADAARVMGRGGPMCAQVDDTSASALSQELVAVMSGSTPWRRARGLRFVPPDMGARAPLFVQWRREDGAWVVDGIGSVAYASLPMPGADVRTAVRDSVPGQPPAWGYAEHAEWYVRPEPIFFERLAYVKYGPPRVLPRDRLERIATLVGIPVYADAGSRGTPELIHVPVNARGEFQSYNGERVLPNRPAVCQSAGSGARPGT